MDPVLLNVMPVQPPKWQPYSQMPEIPGYSQISSLTPILEKLLSSKPEQEGQLSGGNLFYKVSDFEGSGPCSVQLIGKKGKKKAFCKVTHLLDPIRTIQAYYVHPEKGQRRRSAKLNNPVNQAYVDALANYVLGQLREKNVSPHFCLFYGGFQAISEEYRYDITDEYESYRNYKGFWQKKRDGLFDLVLDDDGDSVDDEELAALKVTPQSSLRSTPFSYTSRKSRVSTESHISINDEVEAGAEVELESVKDDDIQCASESRTSGTSGSSITTDSEDTEGGGISVYARFKDYPVMLIFQEEMEGVLDDLLEDDHDETMEEKWTAWTFQIIAALCAMQGILGMTHNDLHTNNIVFSETDQPWIFYKMRDGTTFRVPTYGKLFRIIDFGRAIFRIQDNWFISDDYEKGGDAEGQYRFAHLVNQGSAQADPIYPNPSFDLCRYAVSVIEALYPEMPPVKEDGGVLNTEEDWVIRETQSPFWNLLWSWMVDDNDANVLINQDGSERFPDFDLYQHISAFVHTAKPQEQLLKPIFGGYQIAAKDVGDWETVYPLFC